MLAARGRGGGLAEEVTQNVFVVLGVGEDAARKRVDRAMDDLTTCFRARGFAIPAVTTGVPLFLLATDAAPPSAAAAIVSTFASGASVAVALPDAFDRTQV